MIQPGHVAQNDICPRGSGKTYPDCCGKGSLRAWEQHMKYASQELQRRGDYGEVKQIIHANVQEKKIVAVGNQVLWGDWKFFPDFLRSYLPFVLTTEWGLAENSKPLPEAASAMEKRCTSML
jgi:hypothetical protein